MPEERIQFNVDSLWTGAQNLEGKYKGEGSTFGAYQLFGNLYIKLDGSGGIAGYRKELDIENALCNVSYTQNGIKFRREIFCSYPDQVMALRLTADKNGKCSGIIRLGRGP